jgi:hypothetical protein
MGNSIVILEKGKMYRSEGFIMSEGIVLELILYLLIIQSTVSRKLMMSFIVIFLILVNIRLRRIRSINLI